MKIHHTAQHITIEFEKTDTNAEIEIVEAVISLLTSILRRLRELA